VGYWVCSFCVLVLQTTSVVLCDLVSREHKFVELLCKKDSRKVNSVNKNNYTLNGTSEEALVNTLKGFRKAVHQSGVRFIQRPRRDAVFRRVRKITEKLLSASACLSVRLSAWNKRLPLDGFSWNLIFEDFSRIFRENSCFITFGQE